MDTQNQTPAADKKVQEILVNVVLDKSGSMESCRKSTIEGYNEYLNSLRADTETTYSVSLIQFDSPSEGPELTVSYADKPLTDVPKLDSDGYKPRGMTPLYDAVGECIRRVEAKDRGVITVIITDGHENASKEFTSASIKKLIAEKEKELWKFVFLGANIDSAQVGATMGISAFDCANFDGGDLGVHNTFLAVAQSNVRYATNARMKGLRAAGASRSFTEVERSAMVEHEPGKMGGRPTVPPTFQRPTAKPDKTKTAVENEKRDWRTTVSGS